MKELAEGGLADAEFAFASLLITGVPGAQTGHKPDYEKAFTLYVRAAKKGHADAAYHAALCYEHGRGSGAAPDETRALKMYRKAAIASHPGAMYRLGTILLYGSLNQPMNLRDSIKWLNLSARFATPKHPQALYHLAVLHEHDPAKIRFSLASSADISPQHALSLYIRGADLGYVPCQLRLGHAYQFGEISAKVDPFESIRWYSVAAQRGSAEAMYELSAWHFTGAEDEDGKEVLPPNEIEAYLWARKAVDKGLVKAEYAGTLLDRR
ncbi:hypothetical protein BDK51DRAFT_23702 [Blyttiomyces helicus]|uniref:HCP-like protein n=1 Tax=Blyttiomyces helicus TaxID=388810 RepID=A0A4P9VXY7_9FUNG|nr:hypothetical protein BDK51DRAFT_23702 [Blyttiomyces helicus]|eukprot:RKO83158.1 hypothetical protein BDK51DRAFT_23702 [Blyttiomyces helicus]